MNKQLEAINKCPKCETTNSLYMDNDRINGIKVVACSVCGKRIYESGARVKVRKRVNKKRRIK